MRRSLGVSETAKADDTVKPAPPVDPELPSDDEPELDAPEFEPPAEKAGTKGMPQLVVPDEWKDHLSIELEEIMDPEPQALHDEL